MERGKQGQGKRPAARGADGRTRRPPAETVWGGWLRGPKARSLTWTAFVLSSENRRLTANQVGAEVDRIAGGGETCGRFIAATAERYPAGNAYFTAS